MKEITQEVNKLAFEINSQKNEIDNLTSSLFTIKEDKAKNLEKGFNFLQYSNLIYCFSRLYPLSDINGLSEEAKELNKILTEGLEKHKHLIDGT